MGNTHLSTQTGRKMVMYPCGELRHMRELDISPEACRPFGMYCGDRVKHSKHAEYGGAWVVGVAHNHLYFHWDVDDGATFLQSCSTAEQLHTKGVVLEFSPTRQLQVVEHKNSYFAPDLGRLLEGDPLKRPFSDVCFKVYGPGKPVRVRAHRNILISRSKYFESLLCNGMSESKQEDITLRDTPPAAFAALLQFLYTGETELRTPQIQGLDEVCGFGSETKEREPAGIEDVESDHFCAIFALADKYQVDELKQYCLSRLDSCLSVTNVFKFLLCADALNAPNIKAVCLDFVVEHYDETMNSSGFTVLCSKPSLAQEVILQCSCPNIKRLKTFSPSEM